MNTTAIVKRQTTAVVHVPRVYWYRYEEWRYCESSLMLVLRQFERIKITARGVWLDVDYRKKFVLLDARKRYACPTKEEALQSYRARKERHARILRGQLAMVEAAITLTTPGERVYY